ncbi:MAG: flagellar biosynthesis anti-sigma factor FlgM [Desulfovibrio sp.]|nr:flagellar biosynthesis anti-sigma factor FlgM [Desulfovibrio sp.]
MPIQISSNSSRSLNISSDTLLRSERTTSTEPQNTVQETALTEDYVSVSEDARLMHEAFVVAMETPDVRQEQIDAVRSKMQNGTYEIDSKRIVAGLLQEEPGLFM